MKVAISRKFLPGAVAMWLFVFAHPAVAQQAIFLVRHAEQALEDDDPVLTEVGRRRAKALARVLKDAGINVIYASESRRTTQTAEPLAKALNIDVKIHPRQDMDGLISSLRTQHAHDRILIVSHSLRVPRLLKALGYPLDVTIASKEYDTLFVIIPKSDGPSLVLRLRY